MLYFNSIMCCGGQTSRDKARLASTVHDSPVGKDGVSFEFLFSAIDCRPRHQGIHHTLPPLRRLSPTKYPWSGLIVTPVMAFFGIRKVNICLRDYLLHQQMRKVSKYNAYFFTDSHHPRLREPASHPKKPLYPATELQKHHGTEVAAKRAKNRAF